MDNVDEAASKASVATPVINATSPGNSGSNQISDVITEVRFKYILGKAILNITNDNISEQQVAFEFAFQDEFRNLLKHRLTGNKQRLNTIWQNPKDTGSVTTSS